MQELIIKKGRERSIIRRHPWIFSGAISTVNGTPRLGEPIDVISAKGVFLCRAAYNPNSNITGRIWTWDYSEQVDAELLEIRLKRSCETRNKLGNLISSDAMRLVHGESDGLPGLILDRYGDIYVIQFLTAGMEYWRDDIIDIIRRIANPAVLYERSDVDVRQLEGLPSKTGLIFGNNFSNPIKITENGVKFFVDIIEGHKTGFYLDQRDNRSKARNISNGLKVLDCFAYTGGFAINSLLGCAKSVTLVDSSNLALSYAKKNMLLNNIFSKDVLFIEQDVFKYLRLLRDKGDEFDLVILDPPKFAPTVSQADRASRGYKDINLLSLKILKPGGYLLTFSCSGGVSEEYFQKIITGAAMDAGVDAVIIERMHQAIDHPVGLNFPEGAYLKGFLIEKRS